jgi:hypothetical protein
VAEILPAMKKTIILIAVLALAVAGCGETVIDSAKTEDAIEANLQRSVGLKVSAVDCPSDVEVEPKTTFECTVTQAGGKEEIATLEIVNDDADVNLVDLGPVENAAADK